jgi:hypothetical protein
MLQHIEVNESGKPHNPNVAHLRREWHDARPDDLLTRPVVAAGLNRSLSWMEQLAKKGGGPAFLKVGKRSVLYRKADVLEWWATYVRRVHSTSEVAVQ